MEIGTRGQAETATVVEVRSKEVYQVGVTRHLKEGLKDQVVDRPLCGHRESPGKSTRPNIVVAQ